jgi:hypothetical protein
MDLHAKSRDFVLVEDVFLVYHVVYERTLQGLFDNSVKVQWPAFFSGEGESVDDHAVFRVFLRKSSVRGKDQSSKFRVDYIGEARQSISQKGDDRAKAWKFKAVLDAVQHVDIMQVYGVIYSDYFHLHIPKRIANWENIKEENDLVSYSVESVQRNI